MKICHIVESFGGGVFYAICQIANEQIAQGHSVIIVYSKRWDTPSNYKDNFSKDILFLQINMSVGINIKGQVVLLKTLKKIIKENYPDIIHAHSSIAGFYSRMLLQKKGKLFYTPHGLGFLRKDVFLVSRIIFLFFEKIAHKMGGSIIACSNSEFSEIRQKISSEKIYLLPNVVPTDTLKEYKIIKRNTKNTIVMAGRISPQKNSSLFIDIKKRLDESNVNANYIWFGDGDINMKRELINNGISVTGILERKELWRELSKSTIFLQTSLWEGMPLTLMEAQCIGLPIVANKATGNVDVIKHNINGYIFNSISDAVKILMELLDDNTLWDKFSINSRKYALNKYNVFNYINKLHDIYLSK